MTSALHPALRPANVHGTIKKFYQIPAMMEEMFADVVEDSDNYTDILAGNYVGEIGELSGDAGFKEIKSAFSTVSGRINMFGAFFKINEVDEKLSKVSVAKANMEDMITAMKNYYQNKCLAAWYGISGHSTFDGTKWTDTAVGDPYSDIERASNLIIGACGQQPDTIMMSATTALYLTKFKDYRNKDYVDNTILTKSGFYEKITPNGLRLKVIPDAIASTYLPAYTAIVTKSKSCGSNHKVRQFPFQTRDTLDADNPLVKKYFAIDMKKAVIDEREATRTCVITGLNT
jgi:hypothetical protein